MLNGLLFMLTALPIIIVSFRSPSLFLRRSVPRSPFIISALLQTTKMATFATASTTNEPINEQVDALYPGTAVARMNNIRDRVRSLAYEQLNGEWENVRRSLLWAGGLRDLENAIPGQGYTGHSFNDFNHCDLVAMQEEVSGAENNGQVAGIAADNPLGMLTISISLLPVGLSHSPFPLRPRLFSHAGVGIRIASLEDAGPGGSWTTCMMGCHHDPPRDVAHLQFRSRIAFKLVW